MYGAPYSVTTSKTSMSRYHCSKVAWQSWNFVGKDFDASGGYHVYPADLYDCSLTSVLAWGDRCTGGRGPP